MAKRSSFRRKITNQDLLEDAIEENEELDNNAFYDLQRLEYVELEEEEEARRQAKDHKEIDPFSDEWMDTPLNLSEEDLEALKPENLKNLPEWK